MRKPASGPDQMNVNRVLAVMRCCLDELDQGGASIAAAHLDAAIHALATLTPKPDYPPDDIFVKLTVSQILQSDMNAINESNLDEPSRKSRGTDL